MTGQLDSTVCIFCRASLRGRYEQGPLKGQKRKTNEHIFPRWLQRELNWQKQPLHIEILNSDRSRKLVFDKYLTPICRECNQEWLSKLEDEAKPIVQPLVQDKQEENISFEHRRILALWLFKTAIVLNAASLHRPELVLVPPDHYLYFYKHREIPHGVVISIARFEGQSDLFTIQGKHWKMMPEAELPVDKLDAYFDNSYTITMCAGHLAWRVFYWTKWLQVYGPPPKYDESLFLFDAIRTVHPMGLTKMPWPPGDTINKLGLLHQSLTVKN